MYDQLKEQVYQANMDVYNSGLILFTWGNVSAKDDELKVIAIKPSGVPYDKMTMEDIVIVDFKGNLIEGKLKPSVDLPTHLELYLRHPEIGSIVHTHSTYATAWAQKGRHIPLYGTTHADYFSKSIPCGRFLTLNEMNTYEKSTGLVLAELIEKGKALENPAALIRGHGAFAWGKNTIQAVHNAIVLEEIAKMAYLTETIPGENTILAKHIQKKHYDRKHGPKASYGQKDNK